MRDRRPRPRRARLDAVARRQRGPEGDRRLPANRVDAVRARVLRAVRPALDQPRPDRGRRRAQQGARRVRDGRRHPLPARPGPGRRSSPQIRAIPDVDVVAHVHPPARARRRARNPYVRALCDAVARSTGGEALSVGRDGASDAVVVPGGRHPGRRVRARRRRPPRPGGVGLDRPRCARYRAALVDFVRDAAQRLARAADAARRAAGGRGGRGMRREARPAPRRLSVHRGGRLIAGVLIVAAHAPARSPPRRCTSRRRRRQTQPGRAGKRAIEHARARRAPRPAARRRS